jgi:hypothetical protein
VADRGAFIVWTFNYFELRGRTRRGVGNSAESGEVAFGKEVRLRNEAKA